MSLRSLKNSLGTSLSCARVWMRYGIPMRVEGEELIMRTIFSSANVSEKNGKIKLKPSFMRPPNSPDEDDPSMMSNKLSTTRYDYAGMEFCRCHALHHQSEPIRHYWGFGKFVADDLVKPHEVSGLACSCTVKHKPVADNPAHANIILGFRLKEGETLDSRISEYLKHLVGKAEVIKDPSPTSAQWNGGPVDKPKYKELTYKPKK